MSKIYDRGDLRTAWEAIRSATDRKFTEHDVALTEIRRRLTTLESAAQPKPEPAPAPDKSAKERIADLAMCAVIDSKVTPLYAADRIVRDVVKDMLTACACHAASESQAVCWTPTLWAAEGAPQLAARIIAKECGE